MTQRASPSTYGFHKRSGMVHPTQFSRYATTALAYPPLTSPIFLSNFTGQGTLSASFVGQAAGWQAFVKLSSCMEEQSMSQVKRARAQPLQCDFRCTSTHQA